MTQISKQDKSPIESGRRFGRLVVIEQAGSRGGKRLYRCVCDCGNEVDVQGVNLKTENTQSCGCLRADRSVLASRTHGLRQHPLYTAWANTRQRCTNPNNPSWKNYGGRGITICDEWDEFTSYLDYVKSLPGYDTGMDLDRIDNDGNYEPGNVQWLTRAQHSAKHALDKRLDHR